MREEESLDYEQMKSRALEQLRSGKSLYVRDGAFAPLLKSFMDAALEAEMDAHLGEGERSKGNRRNGGTSKDTIGQPGTDCSETSNLVSRENEVRFELKINVCFPGPAGPGKHT